MNSNHEGWKEGIFFNTNRSSFLEHHLYDLQDKYIFCEYRMHRKHSPDEVNVLKTKYDWNIHFSKNH